MSGLRRWMQNDARRPECISIDQMWTEVISQVFFNSSSSLLRLFLIFSSQTTLHFFSLQIEDLVVKSILCGLTSLKEEMNTGQKKEVPFLFARIGVHSFCYSGEVNIQHVQAAGLRHPARFPPATSFDRGERQTSLPPQPPGRLRQQTDGEQNTT